MGRLKKNGQVGAISGKVGDVVLSEWKNIPVVRSTAKKSSKPATEGQQEQRAKVAKVVEFASPNKKVLSIGYRNYAIGMSGYNAAVSDILKYAVTGQYPEYSLNFSKVLVSYGRLNNEANSVAKVDGGQVVFTWTYEPGEGVVATDKAMLVVYCEVLGTSLYTLKGPDRSTGTASIAVARFKGYDVHTWLAFVAADGGDVSTSTYTGKLTIA